MTDDPLRAAVDAYTSAARSEPTSTSRADLSRLHEALAALDVPERDDEADRFHDGQRWMLGKVRNALQRIHDSGVSPGASTWYRVDNGWRQDGWPGGSMFVEDGVMPGWGPEGPGTPLVPDLATDPMVVHGSISLERDDGDGELHATCKCGVKATFTDEPDGRSAHVAAQEWWQQHQREATDEEDQFGTTCTECLDPLDDAHPYGTNADGDFVHYACSDDSPTADPVILQHPAGYTLAEQVQAVWDEEGLDGIADAIRQVARGEGT